MSKYVVANGSHRKVVEATSIEGKLDKGTYSMQFSMYEGWYLEKVDDFTVPKKIYGDTSIVDRCISVYKNRERNFGLLLNGLRGSGKTTLLRKLAIELDQPVIIIEGAFGENSESALQFLSDSTLGDCTIVIDEFEKKFDAGDPTPLALLDGPACTHHFFILTMNTMSINENLKNRPGRIYYTLQYAGLDGDIVREVAEDRLINKDNIEGLLDACDKIASLSYDMLISVIDDMNTFNQTAKEVLPYFGFTRDYVYADVFQVLDGIEYPVARSYRIDPDDGDDKDIYLTGLQIGTDPSLPVYSQYFDFNNAEKIGRNRYRGTVNIPMHDILRRLGNEGIVEGTENLNMRIARKVEKKPHDSNTPKGVRINMAPEGAVANKKCMDVLNAIPTLLPVNPDGSVTVELMIKTSPIPYTSTYAF